MPDSHEAIDAGIGSAGSGSTGSGSTGSGSTGSGTGGSPLAIGEVLSVLQADHPDVTISKIRFLESQGLVRPERNASGYRQFSDGDVERLRWILRQQRDRFLPLKVIKKALDQGIEVPDAGLGDQPTLWTAAADAAVAAAEGTATEPPDDDAADDDAADGGAVDGGAVDGGANRDGVDRDRARDAGGDGNVADSVGAGSPGSDSTSATPRVVRRRQRSGRRDEGGADRRRRHSTPADVVAALQEDPRPPGGRAPQEPDAGTDGHEPHEGHDMATSGSESDSGTEGSPSPVGEVEGTSMQLSTAELLEASGLTEEQLVGLEQYGLIESRTVGGEPSYDRCALSVAVAATRCAQLGVEPRHLRTFKVAAEREAGLVEQVVMPLLKQRNPAARERASQTATELTTLGAEIHAALLSRELGDELSP